MDWWDQVRLAIQAFMDQHGLLAGFVLVLIEETGIPVPVPGDFLMMATGVNARAGRMPLWEGILLLELATLIGASVLYFVTLRMGRTLVYRYGRYMHLTPERLDRAERWLQRRGSVAIVVGRLTPGLRMATVIACGVFEVPFWRFLPSLALGALLYILIYVMLGYLFGPVVLDALTGIHLPFGLLGSLIPLVVLVVWIVRARRGLRLAEHTEAGTADRRHRWRDGAVAGAIATLVSTFALNVLVHLTGDLALLAPGDIVQHARARLAVFAVVRFIGPVLLLLAAPAYMAVGIAWGAVYAQWLEPNLHFPDWVSGIAFALLPLTVALVVVLPLLNGADPQLGALGPLAAASETIRHVIFGASLGLIYPLRLARLPRRGDVRGARPAAAPAQAVSGAT
ncbi:MAG: DedA family protein [Chloroflexi bacterium]|nr:DedA family protein [Chloroflexota bacterium]